MAALGFHQTKEHLLDMAYANDKMVVMRPVGGHFSLEILYPTEILHSELMCPHCRSGRLFFSGEIQNGDEHLHDCDNRDCNKRVVVQGTKFPRSVERVAENPIRPPVKGNRERPSLQPPAHLRERWARQKQGDAA